MSGMVELCCCLIVVICAEIRVCILVSLLITPPFFTAHFKVTKPDVCHCHLVIAAVADIIK